MQDTLSEIQNNIHWTGLKGGILLEIHSRVLKGLGIRNEAGPQKHILWAEDRRAGIHTRNLKKAYTKEW